MQSKRKKTLVRHTRMKASTSAQTWCKRRSVSLSIYTCIISGHFSFIDLQMHFGVCVAVVLFCVLSFAPIAIVCVSESHETCSTVSIHRTTLHLYKYPSNRQKKFISSSTFSAETIETTYRIVSHIHLAMHYKAIKSHVCKRLLQ